MNRSLANELVGADGLEVLVDEDVVRPVHADVVNLVLAVAQLLAVDKASTVPDDPPAAGPDRALAPPPELRPPAGPPTAAVVEVLLTAVVDGDVAVAEDEPHPASPIAPHISPAAVIRRLLLFGS